MREENSHILRNAINDLPLHRAETKLWDQLENSLFDYPVHAMPLHSPEPDHWDKIEGSLLASSLNNKLFKKRWLAVLIVLLGSTLAYFGITYTKAPKVSPETKSIYPITEVDKQFTEEISFEEESNEVQSLLSDETLEIKKASSLTNISTPDKNLDQTIQPASEPDITLILSNYSSSNHDQMNRNNYAVSHIQSKNLIPILSEPDLHQGYRDDLECSSFTGSDPIFTWGVTADYYSFLTGNKLDDTQMQHWISSGLEVGYHQNKWSIISGVGMIFSEDKSKLEYHYIQNELIHSYEYVDSVHFDPVTGTTHYYTTTVDVYDSIEYREEEQIESSYVYLQIPLFAGYEIYRKKSFAINVSGGLSYAYLLRQTETYPGFNNEEARLIGANSQLSTRKDHLFLFHARFGFQYEISRNICIDLHPAFNYSSSPIYENSTGNPYAWSIGASIRFKL